jgi:hypothetical protein
MTIFGVEGEKSIKMGPKQLKSHKVFRHEMCNKLWVTAFTIYDLDFVEKSVKRRKGDRLIHWELLTCEGGMRAVSSIFRF